MMRVRFPRSVYRMVNNTWFTKAVITNLVSAVSLSQTRRSRKSYQSGSDPYRPYRRYPRMDNPPVNAWRLPCVTL